MLGTIELVLGTTIDAEQREHLEMARSSADVLLAVINDVLDFSKIEAGQVVRDTGIGISAGQRAHTFEPFKHADGSITRKYGGTGLGLSICQRLVGAMGGRIWLESEEGRGTTFYFTVRAAAADATETAAPAANAPAIRPLRLLLAEDNRVNQRLAVALLRRDGHRVTVVDNGEAAVAAAASDAFDATLMDVQMAVMSGLDAAAAIRARHRDARANRCDDRARVAR